MKIVLTTKYVKLEEQASSDYVFKFQTDEKGKLIDLNPVKARLLPLTDYQSGMLKRFIEAFMTPV